MLGRHKKSIETTNLLCDTLIGVPLILTLATATTLLLGPSAVDAINGLLGTEISHDPISLTAGNLNWNMLGLGCGMVLSLVFTQFHELDLFAGKRMIVARSLKAAIFGIGLAVLILYLAKRAGALNRSLLLAFGGTFFAWLVAKELLLRRWLTHRYFVASPLEALLVCQASDVQKRANDFSNRNLANMRVRGVCLTGGSLGDVPHDLRARILGSSLAELPDILSTGGYDLVFLGDGKSGPEVSQEVLAIAEEQGIETWYFADFLHPKLGRPSVDEYGGKPVIVFRTTSDKPVERAIKRMMDVAVAATMLLLLSPLLVTVAIIIKVTSPGPVMFSQDRTGFRGKTFKMLKFRSMRPDAEKLREKLMAQNEMGGPVFKITDDPRITGIGKWIRRYSVDELPQLVNVLRGEMSLVGPRPLPVYETRAFAAFRDHRRYSVVPGLTGLWQVSGRSEISDFDEWVRLDLEYIDKWSIWLDLQILLRTIPAVFRGAGAK